MKRLFLVLIAALYALNSFGWGQKGHDVVAYIAECNLTNKAYKNVVKILDGHSLVYYANWMDNASNTPDYRYTKTWHYANVDEGFTYDKIVSDTFEIYRDEDGAFVVDGDLVKTLARNVVIDDMDSMAYMQKLLRDKGVIKKLREQGCKDGDVVVIGDVEFDFID